LFLLLLTGPYIQNVYTTIEKEAVAFKLRDIANQVSSTIVDLVSLCFLSEVDQNLTKRIELPSGIDNNLYTIKIDTYTDFLIDETYYVIRTYLTSKPTIFEQSELPWTVNGLLNIDAGASTVSNGSGKIVITCEKTGDIITLGLLRG
jgi:hypothetical protein